MNINSLPANTNESRQRSLYYASLISISFLLIVLVLFLYNQVKLSAADPQANLQVASMVEQLAKSPKDDALKARIRRADARLRAEYFRRLDFARRGNYILGLAAILAFATTAAVLSTKKNSPVLSDHSRETGKYSVRATAGSIAVAVLLVSYLSVQALDRPTNLDAEYRKMIALDDAAKKKAAVAEQAAQTAKATSPPAVSPESSVTSAPAPAMPSAGENQSLAVLPAPVGYDAVPASDPEPAEPAKPAKPDTPKTASASVPTGLAAAGSPSEEDSVGLPDVVIEKYDPEDYSPTEEQIQSNWNMLRGPHGLGIVPAGDYPAKWSPAAGENILWTAEVALPGWGSPVVWEDKVFLTGADSNRRELYCYSVEDGRLLWAAPLDSIDPATKKPNIMEDTGYAPATCVTDGKRVFASFPNGDLFCCDYEGNVVWKKAFGLPENMYGHASSLAMYKNLLIVQFDQGSSSDSEKSAIYGLQAKNGAVVWRTLRPVPNSWSTPVITNDGNSDIIVTVANPWTIAYNPLTGAELWRADSVSGDVAPSPTVANGTVYVANMGSYASAIKLGGSGDVTKSNVLWKMSENLPDISSPLAWNNLLYLVTSDGTLTCLDTADGTKHYEHPFDVAINASPIMVGDKLYLLDSQGTMHIIVPAATFTEESKSIVPDKTLATPAFTAGKIFIRGSQSLYCIGLSQ